jgi:hypothetical protein
MLKTITLGVVFAVTYAGALAEWTKVYSDESSTDYMDLATRKRQDMTVQTWVLVDLNQSIEYGGYRSGKRYSSYVGMVEFDCAYQRVRTIEMHYQMGSMGHGESVGSSTSPGNWNSVIPNSSVQIMLQWACKADSKTREAPAPHAIQEQQIEWGKPAQFTGTLARGTFENCCFEGRTNRQSYYFLNLQKPITMVEDPSGVSHIQGTRVSFGPSLVHVRRVSVAFDEPLTDAVSVGRLITVRCKDVIAGNTGHFPLPVACIPEK